MRSFVSFATEGSLLCGGGRLVLDDHGHGQSGGPHRPTRDGELTYSYDANRNRTSIGYPGGVSTSYSFDFADRPESLMVTRAGEACVRHR